MVVASLGKLSPVLEIPKTTSTWLESFLTGVLISQFPPHFRATSRNIIRNLKEEDAEKILVLKFFCRVISILSGGGQREERDMNSNIRLFLMGLVLVVSFFIPRQGWVQTKLEAKDFIITYAYAIEKRHDGSIWKIFIEAKNPDKRMIKIGIMVDQVGYGHHPTEWIYLKPQYQNYLKGYLQWNINNLRDEIRIVLKLLIVDSDGNESNEVVFPLTIESGSGVDHSRPGSLLDQSKLPPPFDQGELPRLGYINIDLTSSDHKGNN